MAKGKRKNPKESIGEKININYQTLFGRYRKGDRGNILTRPIDEIKSTRGNRYEKEAKKR